MKKILFTIVLVTLLITVAANAQTGIGTSSPNASAALDVSSTNKAFLPPRMSYAQIRSIANPTGGMIVYDNDANGLRVYNGIDWQLMAPRSESLADAPGVFGETPVSGGASLYSYYFNSGRTKIGPNRSLYFVAVVSGDTVKFGSSTVYSTGGYYTVFAKMDSLGNPLWMKALSAGAYGLDLDVDASGNVYIAGSFDGTADFDPGAGTQNLTTAGGYDGFYAKYDANGNYVWAKRLGSTGSDFVKSIVTDGTSVYLTGNYNGTVSFLGGTFTSAGLDDIFLARYQASDGLLGTGWVRSIGGTGSETAIRIKIYGGSVLVGGTFSNTCTFGGTTKTSSGSTDIFFAIYNPFGTFSSVNQIGGAAGDYLLDMTTDATGKIYLCGYFSGSTNIGGYLLSSTNLNGFVAIYNSSLTIYNAQKIGGTTGPDLCYAIAVNAAGEVYLGGSLNSTDYSVAGRSAATTTGLAAFLMKLDANLYPQWLHLADCNSGYYSDFVNGIDVSTDGKMVFSTVSMGSPTYGIGFNGSKIPTPNYFFISRYIE